MKWVPVLRDSILFLTGLGIVIREVLSPHPDLLVMEMGAGMAGIPGVIHGRSISQSGTASQPPSSPESPSPAEPVLPSGE